MSNLKKRIMILTGVCAASALGLLLTQDATRAEEKAAITVGTFEPGLVAQQTGLQQKVMEQMGVLQERMQAAQQSGNQEEMKKIQGEAQTIQQNAVAEFEAAIDKALPEVAKAAGVQLIAIDIAFMAEGIETKDLTAEVVAKLGGEAPQPEISFPPAQQ